MFHFPLNTFYEKLSLLISIKLVINKVSQHQNWGTLLHFRIRDEIGIYQGRIWLQITPKKKRHIHTIYIVVELCSISWFMSDSCNVTKKMVTCMLLVKLSFNLTHCYIWYWKSNLKNFRIKLPQIKHYCLKTSILVRAVLYGPLILIFGPS